MNLKLIFFSVFIFKFVNAFWLFSCPRGNHNGSPGDECSAFCQCKSPAVCEAFRQRCVAPSGYKETCHWTKPCREGLSCQPGVHRCFNSPRRLYEPCSFGFGCGAGLSCAPGFQVCFNHPRHAGQPCSIGYPCAHGLSCQPGVQKCYHAPRLEEEPCSLGFGCARSLSCSLCGHLVATCQMARVPAFSKQDLQKPYNKVAFLVTHNSFAHGINFGIWAHNQRFSVTKQLNDGVRGLMLDIYPGWNDADVRLCHATCVWSGSSDLLYTLIEIREFLERNLREVVTIIFEDYLRNPRVLRKVFDDAGISKYVMTSEYWGDGEDWPTLSEMISLGHRLVVFNNVGMSEFPYSPRNMWSYVIENRYGSSGKSVHECKERVESRNHVGERGLVLVNWFTEIPDGVTPCLNDINELKQKLTTCYKRFGKWANFLVVDYYSKGSNGGAFKTVRWLNEMLTESTRSNNLETFIEYLEDEINRI